MQNKICDQSAVSLMEINTFLREQLCEYVCVCVCLYVVNKHHRNWSNRQNMCASLYAFVCNECGCVQACIWVILEYLSVFQVRRDLKGY